QNTTFVFFLRNFLFFLHIKELYELERSPRVSAIARYKLFYSEKYFGLIASFSRFRGYDFFMTN
ncbi:MAG: hypothetical protein LBH47_00765, partial [Christensenellaceae bacterium]|nr:hypothetical protein [Christensenellaceae bacterium]